MSNRPRPLLPRPSDLPPSAAPNRPPRAHTKRRAVVPVACLSCRQRRIRCDGETPCASCKGRGVPCDYDGQPGISRAAAQRERVDRIKLHNASLMEALWFLQTQSPEKAHELVEFARTQDLGDVAAITRWLEARDRATGPSTDDRDKPHSSSTVSDLRQTANPSSDPRSEISSSTASAMFDGVNETSDDASDAQSDTDALDWRSHATVATTVKAAKLFLKCTRMIFHVFRDDHVEELINGSLPLVDAPDSTDFLDLFRSNPDMRIDLAEVAGMAGVGLLHLRFKSRAKQTEFPSWELAQHFYDIARWALDSIVLAAPLRAMKLCALLALHNIVLKASVALVYVDIGVGLGRRNGMDGSDHEADGNSSEWEDQNRTWRTLLLFSGWLGATLGFVPGEVEPLLLLPPADHDLEHESVVQTEIVKITIVKAKIIRNLRDVESLPDSLIASLRRELDKIHKELPSWMSMQALSNGRAPQRLRPVVMYLHLFYLSALQLLHRRVMKLDIVGKDHAGVVQQDARGAIAAGLTAARFTARFLELMKNENTIDEWCWLCIFSSYTTAVILLQATVQKVLHGFSAEYWTSDYQLVLSCLDVLSFCAEIDEIASLFRDLIQFLIKVFQEIVNGDLTSISRRPDPVEDEGAYVFAILEGDTPLHTLARDLLRLIRQPFEQNLELAPPVGVIVPTLRHTMVNSMESGLGTFLEWNDDLVNHTNGLSKRQAATDNDETFALEALSAISPGTFVEEQQATTWFMWTPR